MNKELFLQFVRAVIVLATTKATDTAALAKAQEDAKTAVDSLEALKASDAAAADANKLTDDENSEVQNALNLISAATPPPPASVDNVVASVPQDGQS